MYADTWWLFHDALSAWWEKEAQDHLEARGFRDRQPRAWGDTNAELFAPIPLGPCLLATYLRLLVGNAPEVRAQEVEQQCSQIDVGVILSLANVSHCGSGVECMDKPKEQLLCTEALFCVVAACPIERFLQQEHIRLKLRQARLPSKPREAFSADMSAQDKSKDDPCLIVPSAYRKEAIMDCRTISRKAGVRSGEGIMPRASEAILREHKNQATKRAALWPTMILEYT